MKAYTIFFGIILAYATTILTACEGKVKPIAPNEYYSAKSDSLRETLLGPYESIPDTSNQYIYDFMKVVIREQKLDLKAGLQIEPETDCSTENDEKFLRSLEFQWEKDLMNTDIQTSLNGLLTAKDVDDMLMQRKSFTGFKWDNSRLGFNLTNRKNWYSFSIPLFSRHKDKVIMKIESLCPGLCGTGHTVIFVKENDKWVSHSSGYWYN